MSDTTCTCQYPGDCCPACYEQQKLALQRELYEATLVVARLQTEVLALEQRKSEHKKSNPNKSRARHKTAH